jgi:hypothetical protein
MIRGKKRLRKGGFGEREKMRMKERKRKKKVM